MAAKKTRDRKSPRALAATHAKPRVRKRRSANAGTSTRATPRAAAKPEKWSAAVMRTSDAMDLTPGVFKLRSPGAVARSLKKSAEASRRRKSTPFRSAMSMLNFEINRGGKNLTAEQRRVLNQAKGELRKLFERPPA